MTWVWKRLAPYVRAATTIDISGISAEELHSILHQDALNRLNWIEAVIFNEEIGNGEKAQAIQAQFLED